MATINAGSTVPRRQLGRHLRQLREDAHMTIKAASETLQWSQPKIWRIESGMTSTRSPDVAAMCRIYGASDPLTEALMGLAQETRTHGWWHSYGDAIPEWFELYVELEATATRLRKYESHLVPGLLQTEAYAEEVFRIVRPDLSPADREERIALRLARQAILARVHPKPPRVEFVLDEAVLCRRIKDPGEMSRQLRQINVASQRSDVAVRVLPFAAGLHKAGMGAFTILEFPAFADRPAEPTVVYSEGLAGALYLEKPAEIAKYEQAWASISSACLSQAQSRELIASLAEEYASC